MGDEIYPIVATLVDQRTHRSARTPFVLHKSEDHISCKMPAFSKAIVDKSKHLFWTNRIKLSDQFGLTTQINEPQNALPEFLFLGSTNVGKSSSLTSLLNPPRRHAVKNSAENQFPRVSKRAGFTETISVYTIGRSLRLCDSPGYGFKSTGNQGEVVTKYLDVRAPLIRSAYVLLHAKRGLSIQDSEICQILSSYGIPFNFVITKADLGIDPETVQEDIDALCSDLAVPRTEEPFLTSTKFNTGIDELRAAILSSSGVLEAMA